MNTAAYLGRLEAVKWLHANRTEGCTSNAMHYSARLGRFEMVKWLYLNRPESHTSEAIVRAIRSGHLRIAYWLARKYPKYSIHCYWFDIADKRLVSSSNSLEVLLFLRAVYPYVVTANFTRLLRSDYSNEKSLMHRAIVSWLDDTFPCAEEVEP
ncbi:hypothetical protein JG687_00014599 [Phytophthora cactorum]|uniref:Ankyrin repeat-containing domain n=1 Tax=Phytophthora cactorum TaxID=29920 RepID=A0A8T1TZA9_9STRA|nr:hypothetical protein JG687_00014599 [Phytophthora cactorum]